MRTGWNPYYEPPQGSIVNYQHPLANGLRACWLFNEGGATKHAYDVTRGRHHAEGQSSSQLWIASGKGGLGWALNCDGTNDWAIVENPSGLEITTDLTAEVWLRCPSQSNKYFFGFFDLSTPYEGWGFRLNNSKLSFWSDGGGSWRDADTVIAYENPDRHHGVAVLDGSTVYFYVDGVADGSGASGSPSLYTGQKAVLANRSGNNKLLGDVALMRLWDRALTPEEVAWLYREPYCFIRTPAPRKWWLYTEAAPPAGQVMPIISDRAIHSAIFEGLVVQG
ncbi:MAG: LamG domain-containing protein [Armatimonadota bacterium]|jgi:hypothetical protein